MPVQCVAFDLDDTLWDCKPVIRRAEQRFYAWLEQHYPRITARHDPEALINRRIAYMQQYPQLQYNLTRLRKSWLTVLAEEHDYPPSELVETGFEVFWLARNEVAFFDGALETLTALAGRYCLGVVSNGNASVHHIGIGHLFQFVHSAEQAGIAKPHPDIFRQALAKAGVAPQEAVYVGDDPVCDMQGAMAAGMRTVWFNPQQQPWEEGPPPDATIASLTELETALTLL